MVPNVHDFAGCNALVTGATSGIGEAAARAFAASGASVVLAGRRTDLGESIAEEIRSTGARAHFVRTDVSDPAAVRRMLDETIEHLGGLDFAFNNAGTFDRMHEFHSYDETSWSEMIEVNLTAVFRCMKLEIAAMLEMEPRELGGRSIVNCASTVAHRGSERASPAYVASKHAVLGLTRQAAVEYANRGIRINAVSPGPTLTDVSAPLVAEGPEAVQRTLEDLNPRAQFVGVDEVAHTVLFLCSDAANMINGHDIAIDGGQLAKL